MLSMVNGLGLCRRCTPAADAVVVGAAGGRCNEDSAADGGGGDDNECSADVTAATAAVVGDGVRRSRPGGNGAGGGESAANEDDDDRPNVASNRARSAACSLNRFRRRRNEPFSNMSRAAGCRAQYAPLPGLSGRRGIFTKQSLNDRLCRSEFCHLENTCNVSNLSN